MTIIDSVPIARHSRGLRSVLGVMASLGVGPGLCIDVAHCIRAVR